MQEDRSLAVVAGLALLLSIFLPASWPESPLVFRAQLPSWCADFSRTARKPRWCPAKAKWGWLQSNYSHFSTSNRWRGTGRPKIRLDLPRARCGCLGQGQVTRSHGEESGKRQWKRGLPLWRRQARQERPTMLLFKEGFGRRLIAQQKG